MNPFETWAAKYNYGRGKAHAEQVSEMSLRLLSELRKLHLLVSATPYDEFILDTVGYLHDIGVSAKALGKGEHNERSCETLNKALTPEEMAQLEEPQIILDCILFHRGDLWRGWRRANPKKSEHAVRLAAIVRIGDALDRSLQQPVQEISLQLSKNIVICEIVPVTQAATNIIENYELPRATQKSDLFKDVFGLDIVFKLKSWSDAMNTLNFSWIIDGKLSGHRAPVTSEDLSFLKMQGVKALVRMKEGATAEKMHQSIMANGLKDLHVVVPDFTAPSQTQIVTMIDFISQSTAKNEPVAVSCGAGYGRTGTILACYLVKQSFPAKKAIEAVRNNRPGSIETPEQEAAIHAYAKSMGK